MSSGLAPGTGGAARTRTGGGPSSWAPAWTGPESGMPPHAAAARLSATRAPASRAGPVSRPGLGIRAAQRRDRWAGRRRGQVGRADPLVRRADLAGRARAQLDRGLRDEPARLPRQGEPEHRALAGLAVGLQPAAVQPRVLEGDGQTESGPPAGAGARRVGSPEPVEHQLRLAVAQADTPVLHRDGDGCG